MASIITEIKHMEFTGCLDVGGKYDNTTGICKYNVIVHDDGRKEYLNNKTKIKKK